MLKVNSIKIKKKMLKKIQQPTYIYIYENLCYKFII